MIVDLTEEEIDAILWAMSGYEVDNTESGESDDPVFESAKAKLKAAKGDR
jgi:hypothetical protein